MIVGKGTGAIISRIPSYNTAPAEGAAIGRSDFVSGALCRRRKKGLEEKATKKGRKYNKKKQEKKRRKENRRDFDVFAIAIASGRVVWIKGRGRRKRKKKEEKRPTINRIMPPTILSIQLQLCNIPIDNISIVSTALAAIVARTKRIRRFAEESIVVIDIVARGRSVVNHYGIFRSLVAAVVG